MSRVSRRDLLGAAGITALAAAAGAAGAACTGARRAPEESAAAPKLRTGAGQERQVRARIDAQPTSDGAGVKLSRSTGGQALAMLDPFLLLDELHTDKRDDYIAGFPDHPHRGFETVTYTARWSTGTAWAIEAELAGNLAQAGVLRDRGVVLLPVRRQHPFMTSHSRPRLRAASTARRARLVLMGNVSGMRKGSPYRRAQRPRSTSR